MKTKIPCLNIDTSKRDTRLKKNKNNVVEIVAYSHIDISPICELINLLLIIIITCNRMHYWWINGRFHFLDNFSRIICLYGRRSRISSRRVALYSKV